MSKIRSRWLALAIVGAAAISLASYSATAAPPAKPPAVYTAAGGATTINGNYTRIVELSLPAGKYLVGGRATINNQQAVTDTVSCNVYASAFQHVDANTETVNSGEYGGVGFAGAVTLASSGTLWLECIATTQATGPFTTARLTATTVTDIQQQ